MAIIRTSLLAALTAAAFTASAAADSLVPAKVLGPLKAGMFHLGSKQALAYYEAEKDACKVTILLTAPYDETKAEEAAVRFNTSIFAGTSTRIETNEGASLAMVCAPGAATLFVQTVDRVAYVAPAK